MPRPKSTRDKNGPLTSERDSLDFRDWIYQPILKPLPEHLLPRKTWIRVLDQGEEGACTGFGLAAVINYLIRARGDTAAEHVSPYMLYEMAKRHDRWPGHRYDGSTARGAVKGWYKNGVCLSKHWKDEAVDPGDPGDAARQSALSFPAGAFYRILPRRSDVHAALQETQVVFVSAATHAGWDDPDDGMIEFEHDAEEQGGHAFAIVGYTHEGFLIQNSWGDDWGGVQFDGPKYKGCAIWQYHDFDHHVWDMWVARLARPVESVDAMLCCSERRASYTSGRPPTTKAPPRASIRDHFIHIDDGQFDPHGDFWSTPGDARRIVHQAVKSDADHILLYAHGGMTGLKDATSRVAKWQPVFAENKVHEIHLIWETGLFAELRDVLFGKQTFVEGRAGGVTDWTDRWIERAAGPLGRGLWREMLTDADIAFDPPDAARPNAQAGSRVLATLADELAALPAGAHRPRLHLVGHSAGSVMHGHLLARAAAMNLGLTFDNLILFAPACTHEFFGSHIKPSLVNAAITRMHHFLLDDDTEKDDSVAVIYRKSILYLVSRSFQQKGVIVPILGMEKHLPDLDTTGVGSRMRTYNTRDHRAKTQSQGHSGFDNDLTTMNTMLEIVCAATPTRLFTKDDLKGY